MMKDLAEALKGILSKIGDFFDIFDLSFIVSGAAALSSVAVWWKISGRALPLPAGGWARVFAVVLACYISGLFCFALGRWIRLGPKEKDKKTAFMTRVELLARSHGLTSLPEVERYLGLDDDYKAFRLYIRLWAELRENVGASPSVSLLNRSWVLAATYDGVAIAVGGWLLVIVVWMFGVGIEECLPLWLGLPVAIGLILGFFALQREAKRSQDNQADELFATIAAARRKFLR